MRARNLGSLVILAFISSCGSSSDGGEDTDVGAWTQSAHDTTPSPEPRDEASDPPSDGGATLAGVAGGRFIVFDTEERTVVFDTATERPFGVFGHPITETAAPWDAWAQVGMSPAESASRVTTSADGTTMLVKTATGIQAVDLTSRGTLLAGWRGDAARASVAPDGSAFAALGRDFVDVVRVADGAHVRAAFRSSAGSASSPTLSSTVDWTSTGAAYWRDDEGVHVIDPTRSAGTFRTLHVAMPGATLAVSKNGATFVVYQTGEARAPGVVEIWSLDAPAPRARAVSAFVSQVTMDDDASHVAWAEQSQEYDAPTFLHVLDVSSGVHVRFGAKGEHCPIDAEHIVGFEDGALKTDAECSPGCPSLSSQAQFITYDITTGRKTRAWRGELLAPYNDELGEQAATTEALVGRLGVERIDDVSVPMIHHPSLPVVLVVNEASLDLVAESDAALITRLEPVKASSSPSTENVHFTPDGAYVVGIGDDEAVTVWRTRDGKRVWSRP